MILASTSTSERRRRWTLGAILALGASGVMGQALLWRELLSLYQGNELTTGIILANWLLAEAVGAAMMGRRRARSGAAFEPFALLTVLYAAALTVALPMARLFRPWLGLALGEPAGPAFVFWTSLTTLAAPAFLHGALFPAAGRLLAAESAFADRTAVGALYVWEGLGALLGGVIVKLYFHAGGDGLLIVVAVWSAAAAVVGGWPVAEGEELSRRITRRIAAALAGVFALCLGGYADRIQAELLRRQFHPYAVVSHASSAYANWVVLASGDQFVFVADGQPTHLAPIPDRLGAQIFAHLPLLAHPSPRRVAVLGGGVGGFLEEILRHDSLVSVDYTELDAAALKLFRRHASERTARELDDPRVRFHVADGRRWLRTKGSKCDIVWIGAPEPDTLHNNRYYTLEAFQSVCRRLAPDGIVAMKLRGRLALATEERRRLHASVYESLRRTFGHVRVLPGEGFFLYLASPERSLEVFTAEEFHKRLKERGLEAHLDPLWPIEQRLHAGWADWYEREYLGVPAAANRTLRPVAVFHALADSQAIHAPRAAALARAAERWFIPLMAATVGALLVGAAAARRYRRARGFARLFQVGSTGFAGMTLDLAVILTFQSALGYMQSWMGLLVGAYMTGAAGAAAIGARWAAGAERASLRRALLGCDLVLALLCATMPPVLSGAVELAGGAAAPAIAVFLTLNLAAGALTGVLFPLAAAWRIAEGDTPAKAAGSLQAADLLGGWCAGWLAALLILPLAGVWGACATLATLKVVSALANAS